MGVVTDSNLAEYGGPSKNGFGEPKSGDREPSKLVDQV